MSDSITTGDELLDAEEVSAWLKVPVTTLYQWRVRGKGPRARKVGRWLRYRRSDVEQWLDEPPIAGDHPAARLA
jgi:excisionase family DNA binding protein